MFSKGREDAVWIPRAYPNPASALSKVTVLWTRPCPPSSAVDLFLSAQTSGNNVEPIMSNMQRKYNFGFRHPSQFKEMAVDSQVRTPSGHTFDVLYVGTTKGRVLKLVNTADPNGGDVAQRPVFIEEMQLYPSSTPIDKLKVVRDENGGRAKLVVLTRDQVAAVPLARCAILAKSCGVCVALQDPYCAWSVRDGQCISLVNSDPDRLDSAAFLQNVFTGQHEGCGHDSSLEATGDLAQTGIRIFLPGKNNEEFHPQASGSFVKAPAVQEKDQQTGIDLEEKENFQDAGLPGTFCTHATSI